MQTLPDGVEYGHAEHLPQAIAGEAAQPGQRRIIDIAQQVGADNRAAVCHKLTNLLTEAGLDHVEHRQHNDFVAVERFLDADDIGRRVDAQVIEMLAEGKTLKDFEERMHQIAEGAVACRTVTDAARKRGIEMPIAEVTTILAGAPTACKEFLSLMEKSEK